MMIKSAIKFSWAYFWDAWRFIEREGRWQADSMHLDIIEAVLDSLGAGSADLVRQQLSHRYFFSWMSDGRINVFFFYDEEALPLLPRPDFDDRLYRVELFVEGKKQWAQVAFFQCRIHRIELKKSRGFFKGKAYKIGEVSEGKSTDTYTRVIDRAAHGKETENNP